MSDQERKNLQYHENCSISYSFLAGTDYSTANTKIAAKTGFTINIIKITLSVTTDNAATQLWQSNNGTPVEIAKSKASPGLGPITWDFGSDGFAVAEGEALQHKMSAAGMAGTVSITAYYKRTTGKPAVV